ncbi:MAG TPA: hypothetical protein VLD38_07510 [Nitrosopumilaceae archaeon]|nr:hypothetical protein [Nitrosopumilaceae archaeon]
MDKLVTATGIIATALGIGFIAAHQIAPQLSEAYLSGGAASIGIGILIIVALKLRSRKEKELLR